jgi:hypothetical protein
MQLENIIQIQYNKAEQLYNSDIQIHIKYLHIEEVHTIQMFKIYRTRTTQITSDTMLNPTY